MAAPIHRAIAGVKPPPKPRSTTSLGIAVAVVALCLGFIVAGAPNSSASATGAAPPHLPDTVRSSAGTVYASSPSIADAPSGASPVTTGSGGYPPPSWILTWGVSCLSLGAVGSAQLWTPVFLANAPHLGSTWINSTISSTGEFSADLAGYAFGNSHTNTQTWSSSVASGETGGLFELDTWTMYAWQNTTIAGFGYPCSQNFEALITSTSNTLKTDNVASADSFYSQGPNSFTYGGYSSIIMDYAYTTNNYGTISTCGGSAASYTVSNAMSSWMGVDVSMSVTIGTTVSVQSSLLGFDMSLSGSVGSSNTFTYLFPANGGTWYFDELSVAGATGASLAFWWVPCGWVSGAGDGCVATGTSVLTTTGWEPVQNIRSGNQVRGFNVTSGNLSTETVTTISHTTSSSLVKINGNLVITSLDQPILIRNSTFLGIIHDPQNLTVGDQFLDPIAWLWVNITSLSTIHTATTVYDLQANGWFNWIVKAGGSSYAPMFDKWPV